MRALAFARRRSGYASLCVISVVLGSAGIAAFSNPVAAATGSGPISLVANSGKCVDHDVVSGRVQVWDCLDAPNQAWTLNADGTLATGGVCMQLPAGQTGNGTLVQVATCNGTAQQRWTQDANQTLSNAASGRCLDLASANQTNGRQLQVFDCLGNSNQQWNRPGSGSSGGFGWTATWTSAMQDAPALTNASNLSCRNISRVSIGGAAVRIRLSNLYVGSTVTFNAVTVGIRSSGASIAAGTLRAVTFGGATAVTIPANAEVWSDSVALTVAAGQDLATSAYIAGSVNAYTNHAVGLVSHYCTDVGGSGGNETANLNGAAYPAVGMNVAWVSGVDVSGGTGAVIALGDSITDGVGSTGDAYATYPADLARRLRAAGSALAVVNEGISGNTVSAAGGVGETAVLRFTRDVLNQSNAKTVIIMEGTNDIGHGASAQSVIDGLSQLTDQAHAAGIRVVGATLIPRRGGWGGNDDVRESSRAQVNNFIRTSPRYDSVVDFDAVLRNTDPNYPSTNDPNYQQFIKPAYDADHVHPNDAGYLAMADAISIPSLTAGTGSPAPTGAIRWAGNFNKCLDRDVMSGRVQIYDCLGGSNQTWTLNADGTLRTGGVCMQTPGVNPAPNFTLVQVYSCNGGSNQKWSRGSNGSIVNQLSNRCLDLASGDATDGRQLQVYDCVGGLNQGWSGPA